MWTFQKFACYGICVKKQPQKSESNKRLQTSITTYISGSLLRDAFYLLPNSLYCVHVSASLLYHDFSKPFILNIDANNFASDAVLLLGLIRNGSPICFPGRALTSSEINYSTIEIILNFWSPILLLRR